MSSVSRQRKTRMNGCNDFTKSNSTYEVSNAPVPVESMTDAAYPCFHETPGSCLESRLMLAGRLGRNISIIACRTEDVNKLLG